MIDPTNITNYNLNEYQLEEVLLFWVLVAGKTAKTTVKLLQKLLNKLSLKYQVNELKPFDLIRRFDQENPGGLADLFKLIGIGCNKSKAKTVLDLVRGGLKLSECNVDDLEGIYGIGPKTARCFLIHSRKNVRHAGLDTHILKWLKSLGCAVPKSTPSGKAYAKLEKVFLDLADALKMVPADLDLKIWNAYSSGGYYEIDERAICERFGEITRTCL